MPEEEIARWIYVLCRFEDLNIDRDEAILLVSIISLSCIGILQDTYEQILEFVGWENDEWAGKELFRDPPIHEAFLIHWQPQLNASGSINNLEVWDKHLSVVFHSRLFFQLPSNVDPLLIWGIFEASHQDDPFPEVMNRIIMEKSKQEIEIVVII